MALGQDQYDSPSRADIAALVGAGIGRYQQQYISNHAKTKVGEGKRHHGRGYYGKQTGKHGFRFPKGKVGTADPAHEAFHRSFPNVAVASKTNDQHFRQPYRYTHFDIARLVGAGIPRGKKTYHPTKYVAPRRNYLYSPGGQNSYNVHTGGSPKLKQFHYGNDYRLSKGKNTYSANQNYAPTKSDIAALVSAGIPRGHGSYNKNNQGVHLGYKSRDTYGNTGYYVPNDSKLAPTYNDQKGIPPTVKTYTDSHYGLPTQTGSYGPDYNPTSIPDHSPHGTNTANNVHKTPTVYPRRCPTQKEPKNADILFTDNTRYPRKEIEEELEKREGLGQCIHGGEILPPRSPTKVPVDYIYSSGHDSCPSVPKIARSFVRYGGECWILEDSQEPVRFVKCLLEECDSCKKTVYDGTKNICFKNFEYRIVWAYCMQQAKYRRIQRERIFIPTHCTCKQIEC